MQASDVIFAVGEQDGMTYFTFVEKAFFAQNGHLDDSIRDRLIDEDIIPDGFYDLDESSFEYDGDKDDAITVLNKAGFTSSKTLNNYLGV